MSGALTVRQAIAAATASLRESGSPSPRLDAEILLAEALGVKREALYGEPERALAVKERARFDGFVARRRRHEPVAYIVGRRAFRTIEVKVDGCTLVPRPETETLVEVALEQLRQGGAPSPSVLELGTGSGAVSLAIATEHPPARLVVTDVDPRCLEVARRNAADLGLLERIEFVTSEYYDDLPPGVRFDLIVANPPYVSAAEMRELPPDVLDYEPHLALLGGEDGMDSYRHIVPEAPVWLETGGVLAVEVAEARAAEVAALFRATGRFASVEVRPDLGGRPRVVFGRERP